MFEASNPNQLWPDPEGSVSEATCSVPLVMFTPKAVVPIWRCWPVCGASLTLRLPVSSTASGPETPVAVTRVRLALKLSAPLMTPNTLRSERSPAIMNTELFIVMFASASAGCVQSMASASRPEASFS